MFAFVYPSAYSEFIDCEADEVGIDCGVEAGEWVRVYDNKVYYHYMDVIGCFEQQPTSPPDPEGECLLFRMTCLIAEVGVCLDGPALVTCCYLKSCLIKLTKTMTMAMILSGCPVLFVHIKGHQ